MLTYQDDLELSDIPQVSQCLKDLGVTTRQHFKEFNYEDDIKDLKLKKFEERRFKQAYDTLRDNDYHFQQTPITIQPVQQVWNHTVLCCGISPTICINTHTF